MDGSGKSSDLLLFPPNVARFLCFSLYLLNFRFLCYSLPVKKHNSSQQQNVSPSSSKCKESGSQIWVHSAWVFKYRFFNRDIKGYCPVKTDSNI